ncbi:hypothetical protein OHR68_10040 [Spirillospora sp. NBC_00431]
MLNLDDLGPAPRLHSAFRRRAPQVAAAIVEDEKTGLRYVRASYRDAGPMRVEWTGETYRWGPGNGPWETLHPDPEQTADAVALGLGARTDDPR